MLTKDLLRYKLDKDRILPQFIRPTPAVRQLAEDLLACYREHIGRSRGELDEMLPHILHRSRSIIVAKGLARVVEQATRFAEVPSVADWRDQALRLSAELLRSGAPPQARAHAQAVAERLGLECQDLRAQLYGDLPEAAILEAVELQHPETVIERYNLGLIQGLLLHSERVRLELDGTSTGAMRALLSAVRFRGLLAEVRETTSGLSLQVEGPASVVDQASRYGMQLAQLLPAIAALPMWRLHTQIRPPRRERKRPVLLELDDSSGLRGQQRFLGYVPQEYQLLHASIADKCPDWQLDEELRPWPLGDGRLLVPDLQIRVGAHTILVELFHRWHSRHLQQRLQDLKRKTDLPLVVGVDRSLGKRKEIAPLLQQALFTERGFLFSGMPNLRGLQAAVRKVLVTAGT